jgi:WD40 repeat protein
LLAGLVLLLLPVAGVQAEVHTWTDATGKFKIEAEFVSLKDNVVVLEMSDGKRRSILLAKLAEEDQKLIRKLAADDNPFKRFDDPSAPTAPRTIEVDRLKAPEISIAGDLWEVELAPAAELGFEPKAMSLPKKIDFFEGISNVVFNTHAKRGVVFYSLGRGDKASTRIVIVDIESGKLLCNEKKAGKFTVLALHNDGERIVVQDSSDTKVKGLLNTMRFDGKGLQTIDIWEPYGEKDNREIVRVELIGEDKLMTCNDAGNVVVWNFDTREPLMRFDIPRTTRPKVSPDQCYIAFCGGNRVGFVDIEKQRAAASKAAPGMSFWCKCAFSPSGKYLAASSHGTMTIWNTADGSVAFEGSFPGISMAYGLHFPHDDFVLVSNKHLVQWSTGIQLWDYSGSNFTSTLGSTPVFCLSGGSAGALLPMSLPHPAALQMLEDVKDQPDLFVLRENIDIQIDISSVPRKHQELVKTRLTEQITKLKCRVSDEAPLVLRATVTGPVNKAISYFGAGSFVIKQYVSYLEFRYQDKKIWSSRATNTPGSIGSSRNKSYQDQVDDAGKAPNLHFFKTVALPDYLQKPNASTNARGTSNHQSIGQSKVTINGLEDIN